MKSMDRPQRAKGFVLPETIALAMIGCCDLMFTIYLLATGQAWEANPLMASILHSAGPHAFIAIKGLLLAGPLAVAEFARREREGFVRAALRIGIILYLTMFAVAYIRNNT